MFSKKVVNLSIDDQFKVLKTKVYITHNHFKHKTGYIVSLRQWNKKYKYWGYFILLDEDFITNNGKTSKYRMFKETEIKLIDVIKL